MSLNPNIQVKSIALAANQIVKVDVTGSVLVFISNNGPFNFNLNGGLMQTGFSILSVDVSRGDLASGVGVLPNPLATQFNFIQLQDTSGAANLVTFIVANYPVTYANPNATYFSKNAPTYTKGSNVSNIGAGATLNYTGADVGGQARKQIVFQNLDAANALLIKDGAGDIFGTLQPQQTWTIEGNGSFKLNNPNAGAVNCNVGEIFYV